MTNEEQLLIAIKADTTNLMSGLKTASTGIGNFSKKIAGIGKGMTIAGAAITAGFAMAIKTASGFEQSMANVASVAGATKEELNMLSDAARKQGEESVYSASQAADAMYYLGSAGMEVNEIIGALASTMSLAAATQSDLAFTSEAVASTLSQYNLEANEAGRVSNVFAAAISGSQATMEKLKTSMSYVGPMAASMGMTLEDTVGILTNLYNAGYDGSKAGTALRMAFAKMLDPVGKTADTMERLEVAIVDSEGVMRPFKDIINDLGEAGMSAGDAMQIFGTRAGPTMLALVSQGQGAIEDMTEEVTGTQKAFEMTETQIDTFQGTMKLLNSAFEEFQITLVQDLMPALRPFIEHITEIIKKVSDWIKVNPELAANITKIAAVIGGICIVGGPILMAVAAFGGVATAIAAIISPIGLVVVAVAGLAIAWKTNFMGIQDKTKAVVEFLKGLFAKLVKFASDSFGRLIKIIDAVKKAITSIIESFKNIKLGSNKVSVSGIGNIQESIAQATKGLPSHQKGISYVPETGLAYLHEGEGVLDREENRAYRSGGAKSYTININNPVVRDDGDIDKIKQQVREVMNETTRQFNRTGNVLIPGMA
ncbi:phage tail tape measure protein [candidate division WOR-3 bacterium]|nr:phage tail tape measure protein [candidate division WOR-3 bacterium]